MAWLETEKKLATGLPIVDWEPKSSTNRTGLGFAAADMLLRSFGLESLENAVARAKLDGLLVLWHPAN